MAKKTPVNPLNTKMRDIFFDWYQNNYNAKPSWGGAEGWTINEIWKKILNQFAAKEMEATDDAVLASFKKLLENITEKSYQWLWNNLTIQNINSKFDIVVRISMANSPAAKVDKKIEAFKEYFGK